MKPTKLLASKLLASRTNRDVQSLAVTQLLASTSEWMWFTVALVAAFQIAGTGGVSAVAVAAVLPAVLMSPIVSYLADKIRAQDVLSAALLGRSLVLALAIAASLQWPVLWLMVVLIGVEGISALIARPAVGSLLPWVVTTPEELVLANLRMTVAEHFGRLAGPVIGGLLIEFYSVPVALGAGLAISAGSFVASLTVRRDVQRSSGGRKSGVFREMALGLVVIVRDCGLRFVALGLVAVTLMQGILEVTAVPLAHDALGLGSWGPGALIASMGVGGVVAGFSMSAFVSRRWIISTFVLASVGGGLFVALAGAAPLPFLVFPAVALYGAALATSMALGFALIQRLVPAELIGRALGLVEALLFVAQAAGSSLAAPLIASQGISRALLMAGGSEILIVLLIWPTLRRTDRGEVVTEETLMVLGRVPFLSALSVAASERVARSAVTRDVEAGDIVFRQGEFGDRFYIVVSGQLEVAVDGKLVRTLGIGDHFGELALLRRIPRTATVTALTEARLVSVERQDFLGALSGRNAVTAATPSTAHIMPLVQPWNPEPFLRNSQASEETRAAALHTVPLLAGLAAGAILDLVRCAEVIEVTPSTVVVEQDSEPDAYFVIVTGEIRFLVDGEPTGSLSQGDGFGELALLHGTGRTASAVASTAATLLRFPAQAFLEAFGATTDQRKRLS